MDYSNSEMKIDQLIGYFNDGKINLVPSFQRGHVWPVKTRAGLVKNIVLGRPIPAIFLYKEPDGSKYSYNILDGKQRLESLLLFIANSRHDVSINDIKQYFFTKKERDAIGFGIDLSGKKTSFKNLSDDAVRNLMEYSIPTIEINLDKEDQETSLDEIIQLFIDINQQGVKVERFHIVKAMGKNPLLKDVFNLIAIKQDRKKDVFYKMKSSDYSSVLDKLQIMQNLPDQNTKVDRMWERLLEIVLFNRTRKHRPPAQILKTFIGGKGGDSDRKRITSSELKQLNAVFRFLKASYSQAGIAKSKFATDQTHFYTMVTTFLDGDLLKPAGGAPNVKEVRRKLLEFARILDGARPPKKLAAAVSDYQELSVKQTTHIGRRTARQARFTEIMQAL